jgi:hypothetical protein
MLISGSPRQVGSGTAPLVRITCSVRTDEQCQPGHHALTRHPLTGIWTCTGLYHGQ